jgi:hypothetical protein
VIPHFIIRYFLFDIRYSKPTQPPAKKTAGLFEKETLILCYRRVGHRADKFRRARWPALDPDDPAFNIGKKYINGEEK